MLTSYEDFKRSHLNTAFSCSAEGFFFAPVVVEARGGAWGPAAVKVFSELAKAKSMITGEPVATLLTHLYQGLGVILHRENARAALKRMRKYTQSVATRYIVQDPGARLAQKSNFKSTWGPNHKIQRGS